MDTLMIILLTELWEMLSSTRLVLVPMKSEDGSLVGSLLSLANKSEGGFTSKAQLFSKPSLVFLIIVISYYVCMPFFMISIIIWLGSQNRPNKFRLGL